MGCGRRAADTHHSSAPVVYMCAHAIVRVQREPPFPSVHSVPRVSSGKETWKNESRLWLSIFPAHTVRNSTKQNLYAFVLCFQAKDDHSLLLPGTLVSSLVFHHIYRQNYLSIFPVV